MRQWGIDVQKVELSDPKILKQPENSSNSAVGSILKGLGMKSDPKYPTPEEFVRLSHGGGEEAESAQTTIMPPDMNVSLLQMMATNIKNGDMPGVVPPSGGPAVDPKVFSWGKCLETIMQNEFSGPLEEEAYGLYKLEITNKSGDEIYYIHLTPEAKLILAEMPNDLKEDVSVQISSADLASVLEGTLAPLQAYLTGRISASGDVRKLMLFDKLSKRGHKPGTMFSV